LSRVSPENTTGSPQPEGSPTSAQVRPNRYRLPPITLGIIVLTVGVYVLQVLTESLLGYDLPALLMAKVNEYILRGEVWRLITPVLLHGSLIHILSNMYALFVIGPGIERNFGQKRFLALYLVAGILGNTFSFLFTASPSLGASTSIFGLIAAQAIFIYRNRRIFGPGARPMLTNIMVIIFINLMIGFVPGIDYWGHLGGLIGGLIFAWFAGPLYEGVSTPFGTALSERREVALNFVVFGEIGLSVVLVILKFIFQ